MNRRQLLKAGSYLSAAYALPLTVSKQLFAANLPADLVDFTATDLSIAIRDKHTSCTEVMQSYLQHIHTYNPVYNAIISMLDDDELIRQAREADNSLARVQGVDARHTARCQRPDPGGRIALHKWFAYVCR